MSETVNLVYGHRAKSTESALKLALLPGEIGLNREDQTLWMRDYSNNYFNIGAAVSASAFGADPLSSDNSTALQSAINAAALTGRPLYLPPGIYIYATGLSVPAGVILYGGTWGVDPLHTPTSVASVLQYTGSGTAVSVNGSNVRMRDLVIYAPNGTPTKGLLLNGTGNGLESCTFRDILIYGFTGGNALELTGVSTGSEPSEVGGYVAYCSFNNLRIRNAKKGIYIYDVGSGAGFVNTNQWYGGAISGSGFDYCIHAVGGNDNRFMGMSVEPPTSTYGHIVVENNVGGYGPTVAHPTRWFSPSGSIYFDGRIESTSQPETTPTVQFKAGTMDSYVHTPIGIAGWIDDLGHNIVEDGSSKSPKLPDFTSNLFDNANWEGLVAGSIGSTTGSVNSWTTLESGGTAPNTHTVFASLSPQIVEGMNVLSLTVPAGVVFNIRQSAPDPTFSSGKALMFGSWVKTSGPASGTATVQWASFCTDGTLPTPNSTTATVAGGPYKFGTGYTGQWQFLGCRQNMFPNSTVIRPFLSIDNSSGTASVTVLVSAPVCSRGRTLCVPVPTTGTGSYVLSTSPALTGTASAVNLTASGKIIAATMETTGKMGIGQAVGTSMLEITAGSKLHLLLQGSQIPGIKLNTSSANGSARHWGIFTNFDAFGDFQIRVGDANGKDATDSVDSFVVLTLDKDKIATFAGEVKLSTANTVNSSTTNTVTNKIKVVVGSTTYYLLASTSNA